MSAVRFAPVLAVILVLQSYSAAADFSLSPFFGNVCSASVCGKGKCVAKNGTFGFECECEDGWRQTRSGDDQNFKFLPCVIPNCTINNSCANAPAPPPQNRINPSIFDPCYWENCGGGSCNQTSPFTRTCTCHQGYYNLFNSTDFPCYAECAIGLDCKRLGINTNPSNQISPPTSNLPDNGRNHGTRLIPRLEFSWLIALATTLAYSLFRTLSCPMRICI